MRLRGRPQAAAGPQDRRVGRGERTLDLMEMVGGENLGPDGKGGGGARRAEGRSPS